MKTILGLVVCLLALAIPFSSCKKQDEADPTTFAQLAAVSDAEADWMFDDVFNNVLGVNTEVGMGGLGVFDNPPACVQVDIRQPDQSRFPLQITIDFSTGCAGMDGRVRKGKIRIVYSGNVGAAGNSATTAFDGYWVDDIKIEGTVQITNTSTQLVKSYTVRVNNARLTRPNGDFIQWNSEKNSSQVEGILTPNYHFDDVFNLSGQSVGSAQKNGKYAQWSTVVTSPLVKKFSCPWLVKGTISLKKGDTGVAVLHYGTGNCDKKASFTINGAAHEITLH